MSYDNLSAKWGYLGQVIYETLRIDPPLKLPIALWSLEDIQIKDYKILKHQCLTVDIFNLHRNPEEWFEPEKFIPERFDSEHPYFLTPSGKKRKAMSFIPFYGGKRICLGKTLAENLTKIAVPLILSNLDFSFPD